MGEEISEYNLEDIIDRSEQSKILFTGLDTAGKTSIILALQREISQIAMLKPTRQAQRKIFEYLGRQIAEWDLGGQARYRIAYLKQPDKYFDKTAVCIYVMDLQDRARLGESISYFNDVIQQFKKLEITPLIYIFFHKLDPDYLKENLMRLESTISDVKSKISKIVNNQFEVNFNKTTIYDLWSVISSFSQILLRLYPQSELVDKTVKEFSAKVEADSMIVLDHNSLVISQFFKDDASKDLLQSTVPYFMTLNDSFNRALSDNRKMVVERSGKVFYFNSFPIEKIKLPINIIIMKEKNDFPEDEIASFVKIFKPLLG